MLEYIPLNQVKSNPVALRPVNLESEKFQQIVESVRETNQEGNHGIINPISVRKKQDPDTGDEYFEVVDGLHRFTAAREVGLDTIPAQILTLDDLQVLQAQLIGNIQKIETKAYQYADQLMRIIASDNTLSLSELARKLGQSTKWLSDRLSLTKIVDTNIQNMVDEGRIGLANAYTLAKLPPEEQGNYVESAMNDSTDEFAAKASARVKEIREAARKGREAAPAEFAPVAHSRKLSEIKTEHAKGTSGEACKALTGGLSNPAEGFAMALDWILNLDAPTVEANRAKWQADKDAKAEKKRLREEERAKKKAIKAAAEKEAADKAAEALAK